MPKPLFFCNPATIACAGNLPLAKWLMCFRCRKRSVKSGTLLYVILLLSIAFFSLSFRRSIVHDHDTSQTNQSIAMLSSQPISKTRPSIFLKCDSNQWKRPPKHTCASNSDFKTPYCNMESVVILIDNIKVSKGDEDVSDVLGRKEEAELPLYTKNTFLIERSLDMVGGFKRDRKDIFFLKNVLDAIQVQTYSSKCTVSIAGPVLLITRYEYCNLFHTMTDWFNTFFSLSNSSTRPTILFLDGHAKGSLDPVWEQVFGATRFIKSYPPGTRLCLEDATFVPAGYTSPLLTQFSFPTRCKRTMDAFLERFLGAYNVRETQMIPGTVTIVGRKPYLAHPRSNPNKTARVVTNLSDLASQINNSRVVYFETMTMKEQLKVIRETQILIANHGAALTHLLFLNDGASVIEYMGMGTSMFDALSSWRPSLNRVVLPHIRGETMSQHIISDTAREVNTILKITKVRT